MSFLSTPFKLQNLLLPHNVFYAPLAGCSDYPFRKMSAKFRPGLMYCEMVKMDALVRNDPNTFHMLDFAVDMHPIGAQLCGSKPELAGKAAKMIEEMGFDVVDFNCGCPVDKVTKDGSGSGMLKTPELIGDIIREMVAAVEIPVTVKIRAGWDEKSINAPLITQIAEAAGAAAICIHGRTRAQGYKGPANWDYIKECKDVAGNILVIGNGDVFDGASAARMFSHTGCDAVLVSRGTMGAPWIVEDIVRHLLGQDPISRDLEHHRLALLEHFLHIADYHNERRSVLDARRIGCWYLKKSAGTRSFRDQISRAESQKQVLDLIHHFSMTDVVEEEIEEAASEASDCAC